MKELLSILALICHTSGAFAASLSPSEIEKIPVVPAGLVCADDTTSTFAMTGLNSTLADKIDGGYIVILDQTNKKLGRVTNAKVRNITMTAYQSKDSAIGVRFVACALVSN